MAFVVFNFFLRKIRYSCFIHEFYTCNLIVKDIHQGCYLV